MRERASRRLLERESNRRIGKLELRVARLALRRVDAQKLTVERNGLVQIRHVEREMEGVRHEPS